SMALRNLEHLFVASFVLLGGMALSACAHTSAQSASTLVREPTAMPTTETSATADNRKLSAEEIGRRFLKLIESIESKSDINPEHIQRVLQMRIFPVQDPDGAYAVEGLLDDDTRYSITYLPGLIKENYLQPHSVGLFFDYPACPLNYWAIGRKLEESKKYSVASNVTPPHEGGAGARIGWEFYDFDNGISVNFSVNLVSPDADKKMDRICSMSIGVLN
ncbi:MAG: hypothetical protein ACRER3_27305, partial [Pseudomonas fluorescens]